MSVKRKCPVRISPKTPIRHPNRKPSTTYTSDWLAFLATLSYWLIALAMLAVAGLLAPNVAPQLITLLRGVLGHP